MNTCSRFISPSRSRRWSPRSSPGSFGRAIGGRRGAHGHDRGRGAVLRAVGLRAVQAAVRGHGAVQRTVYTWLVSDGVKLQVGFLIDPLSAMMMVVVTFVSLMVHIYTIGYMHDDPGYQRFFSYISLFTFSMLMLVMSNNFMQLFFGWEAVGVVSYLLIGFWYTRPTGDRSRTSRPSSSTASAISASCSASPRCCYATPDRSITRRCSRTPTDSRAPRSTSRHGHLVGDHVHLHLPVHRRHGQVGAGAAARVAARFDGRPDADLGADPRGDHGDGGHLHGGAHVAAVRAFGNGAVVRADHRRDHGVLHGPSSASSTTTSSAWSPIRRSRSSAT
jgi:hypothetical protein